MNEVMYNPSSLSTYIVYPYIHSYHLDQYYCTSTTSTDNCFIQYLCQCMQYVHVYGMHMYLWVYIMHVCVSHRQVDCP